MSHIAAASQIICTVVVKQWQNTTHLRWNVSSVGMESVLKEPNQSMGIVANGSFADSTIAGAGVMPGGSSFEWETCQEEIWKILSLPRTSVQRCMQKQAETEQMLIIAGTFLLHQLISINV
jgi:hypothetical protein